MTEIAQREIRVLVYYLGLGFQDEELLKELKKAATWQQDWGQR